MQTIIDSNKRGEPQLHNTRYSPKRDAILQCLRSTTCPPSAEWVYSQLKPTIPDLSLATVYRNLARFRAAGAVQVIGCVDGEDRYDGDTAPHGHRPAAEPGGAAGYDGCGRGGQLRRRVLRPLQRLPGREENQLTNAAAAASK